MTFTILNNISGGFNIKQIMNILLIFQVNIIYFFPADFSVTVDLEILGIKKRNLNFEFRFFLK